MVIPFVGVFVLGALVDVCYVYWTRATVKGSVYQAALMAALIQVFGVGAILFVVSEPLLLVANVLGHAAGTAIGLQLKASE